MPTELPTRKTNLTASSFEGNVAFIVAVLLMIIISTVVLMHPDGGAARVDPSADVRSL